MGEPEPVLLYLFVQGGTADLEDLAGPGLAALDGGQDVADVVLLDLVERHELVRKGALLVVVDGQVAHRTANGHLDIHFKANTRWDADDVHVDDRGYLVIPVAPDPSDGVTGLGS